MTTEIQKRTEDLCDQALDLIARGELQSLTPRDRLLYYVKRCEAIGLDPATQPLEFMRLNGKLKLYAKKETAAQLTRLHKLSVMLVRDPEEQKRAGGLFAVAHARVKGPDGRESDDVGLVSLDNQRGEAYANACMKAATKAKRRAVLGHCGLGELDESELEGIRGRVERVGAPQIGQRFNRDGEPTEQEHARAETRKFERETEADPVPEAQDADFDASEAFGEVLS